MPSRQTLLSIGVAALVIAGVAGVGLGVASTVDGPGLTSGVDDANDEDDANDDRNNETLELEAAINVSKLDVTALDAATLAKNETGAKPVAVKLAMENGTPRFGVLVVNETGNVSGVVIDATDGTVVRTVEDIGFVNRTVLQDVGGVSEVADLRSAVKAIRAAQRVVPADAMPIEVAIEAERGLVMQEVTFAQPAGERNQLTRVNVDATKGPVVGVVRATNATAGAVVEDANETADEPEPPADGDADDRAAAENDTAGAGEAEPGFQVFGDQVFAEDDEFDTGDEVGVFEFDQEVLAGAETPLKPVDDEADVLTTEEEEGLEVGAAEEEDELGDDDFLF